MNVLSALVVRLGLDAAQYMQGLTKAEYQTKQFTSKIDSQFKSIARTIGGLGIGAAVGAFVKDTISSAAALDDLADATGSSVESLSKLANQAKISGTDFSILQDLMLKLSAGMAGADDESSNVGRALKALGISAKDPAEALQQVASQLNKYADGIGKAAIARDLFSKGGPAFLATLKDIAETTDVAATNTTRQAAEAEKLEKALRRLSVEATTLRDAVLDTLVPKMNEFLEQLREGTRIAGSFGAALINLGTINPFKSVSGNLTDIDQRIKEVTSGGGSMEARWASALGVSDELLVKLKQQKEFVQFIQRQDIARNVSGMGPANSLSGTGDMRDVRLSAKPVLAYTGTKEKKAKDDQTQKRLLEQQLREQENAIRAEQDALRDREHFLQAYYQDDLFSIDAYYTELQATRDRSLQKTLAAYDEEISAIRKFAARKDTKPAERIEAETKIADVIAKQASTQQEADTKTIDGIIEKNRAMLQYKDSVAELSAQVLELDGNESRAAAIRFDIQNRGILARATVSGDTQTAANIATVRAQHLAQVDLNKAAQAYSRTVSDLGIAQSRISLEQQTGSITEIDAINKRSALATKYVDILREQADAQEKIAATLTGTAQINALRVVAQLRLEIDQLAASANELGDRFRDIGIDAVTDGLNSVITGTKSVGQAFKDMEKQIIASIGNIASKNISETLFGKSGPLGGFSEGLAKLFGSGAKAAVATAVPEQLSSKESKSETGVASFFAKLFSEKETIKVASADAALVNLAGSATSGTKAFGALSLVVDNTATSLSTIAKVTGESLLGGGVLAPVDIGGGAADAAASAAAEASAAVTAATALTTVGTSATLAAAALSVELTTSVSAASLALSTQLVAAATAAATALSSVATSGAISGTGLATMTASTTAVSAAQTSAAAISAAESAISDAALIGLSTSATSGMQALGALSLVVDNTAASLADIAKTTGESLLGGMAPVDISTVASDAALAGLSGSATTSTSALAALTGAATTVTTALSSAAATSAAGELTADAALVGFTGGATAGTSALAAFTAAMTAVAAAMTSVVAAASAAAAALSTVAASSAASSAGSFAGLATSAFSGLAQGGGLAGGTNSWRGGLTMVGERGRELVNLPRGAQVIPNHVLNERRAEKSVTVQQTINVLPGASTRTATQAAAKAAIEVQRSTRNL